ncbi:MAG: cryptochrome/photolyase family protein [Deltaproteobacteria bacterium]|nr:cryptochrome/photolyase family protein [Deltaproteobacteria bacterium]
MREFLHALATASVDPSGRRWIYAPYDQLTADVGPLAQTDPRELGLVLIEAPHKAARRPYHKAKLGFVLANQRHFALEQARRGVAVRYLVASGGYADALARFLDETDALRRSAPLMMMEAAERELRAELAPLVDGGRIHSVPHAGWLTSRADFLRAQPQPPWRMDAFYRHVRQTSGLLMQGGKPVGGKYSFDAENRRPWRGEPPSPTPPRFEPDAISKEVEALVHERFAHHPGTLDIGAWPTTAADAERMWAWAKRECLPHFGPFEDAMSTTSAGLFHTRISPLLNLHRLLPARVVAEVATDDRLPLSCREGFVRQILGWREFVRHVHCETDGFRRTATAHAIDPGAGDGGFARWRGEPWPTRDSRVDGGASPSTLGASAGLPPAYWGGRSGLACLDGVVADVWRDGWSHHITRLMVLANFATLLGVSPRELTDWFWAAYVDAFDWVVEPNVLAMGSFAVGELMTTKPYVCGAAYIHKMSDYCDGCAFDPKRDCPITPLYWAFMARHADALARNPRVAGPVASLRKRSDTQRARDEQVLAVVRDALDRGEALEPGAFAVADAPVQNGTAPGKRSSPR